MREQLVSYLEKNLRRNKDDNTADVYIYTNTIVPGTSRRIRKGGNVMKYKVGDKVRVRYDLIAGKRYGGTIFLHGMAYMLGKETEVVFVDGYGRGYILKDGDYYSFTDEMLEPIGKEKAPVEKEEVLTADPFAVITEEMFELYLDKSADYGDSFSKSFDEFGLISAVIRLTDKVNRLRTLVANENLVKDESIRDTLIDLANYSIMTIIELDKQKGDE